MKYMLMMHAPRAGWEAAGIGTWPHDDIKAHIGFMMRFNKELKDAGELQAVQVSVAKRSNVRAAIDIARSARTILGANGITLEYPVSRHMANLESVLTYEGTEEVHTLIIGKELTGENAFS